MSCQSRQSLVNLIYPNCENRETTFRCPEHFMVCDAAAPGCPNTFSSNLDVPLAGLGCGKNGGVLRPRSAF